MRFVLAFVFVLLSESSISAATYVVTSNGDGIDMSPGDGICLTASGDCTLRAAITTSNEQSGPHTIVLGNATPFTVVVSLGPLPAITSAVTITSPDPGYVHIVPATDRLAPGLTIRSNQTVNLTRLIINGFTPEGVVCGGGILHDGSGTLNATRLVIQNNRASDGGGICMHGPLNLIDSTISGNVAQYPVSGDGNGGGIIMRNTIFPATIIRSTISGNQAAGGGGVYEEAMPAGVLIINSTISGNSARSGSGSGFRISSGSLKLVNVTISGQVSNGVGSVRVRNSIIGNASGAFESLGNNIIFSPGSSTGFISTDRLGLNPQFGVLADNGGLTQTHALMPNSPAIDTGNPCVVTLTCPTDNPPQALTADQRNDGYSRLMGESIDVGAFELDMALSYSNETLTGRVFRTNGEPAAGGIAILTNSKGIARYASVNPVGYFRFGNLFAGMYTLEIRRKRKSLISRTIALN